MELKVVYGVIAVISLILIAGYMMLIQKRNRWFVMLFISVAVVNCGYFALSAAGSLGGALMANRLAYFGSVFLPLCMLMLVMEVCHINKTKGITIAAVAISIIVFLIAASGGITDWYYSSVSVEYIGNTAHLVKTYGPLHNVYYLYLLAYLAIMVGIILHTYFSKKTIDYKHAIFLTCVVLANEAVWLVEQFIREDFEFLSISYIITEVFMLFLYMMLQEHDAAREKIAEAARIKLMTPEEFIADKPELQILTGREKDVLKYILEDAKRSEIAEKLNVSENTIKKHTNSIYNKLKVADRRELFAKLEYR